MSRLRGAGRGRGMALGTAAIVRMRNGFPLLPPIPARIADQLAKRKMTEMPDVILVAEDYRLALDIASSLRWARVVGIAAASAPSDAPISALPAVVNVAGLLDIVQDDMLIVVDADHDLVIADPIGLDVAHYQAERDKIAPRRRLFLDDVHLPAETLDGRAVLVPARVETSEQVTIALEQGADAIYVPFDAPLMPEDVDDVTQRRNLLELIDHAAGKPLLLADHYALPPMLLLEASLRADLMIAVPLQDHLDGLGLGELGSELNEAQADCLANDAQCELPRLAVLLTSLDRVRAFHDLEQMAFFMDRLAVGNAIRLVLDSEYPHGSPYERKDLALLDLVVAAANATMLPVIVAFDRSAWKDANTQVEASPADDYHTQMRFLVGVGASGIIAGPSEVKAMKAAIREMNFSECREALSEILSGQSS